MPETACLHIQARDSDPIRVVELPGTSVRIGRASYCEVRLAEPELADEECRLKRRDGHWQLVPTRASAFVSIDGHTVDEACPLPYDVPFRVGEFWLTLRPTSGSSTSWGDYQAPPRPAATTTNLDDFRASPYRGPSSSARPGPAVQPTAPPASDGTDHLERWKERHEQRTSRLRAGQGEKRWEERWRAAGERLRARAAAAPPAPPTGRITPPLAPEAPAVPHEPARPPEPATADRPAFTPQPPAFPLADTALPMLEPPRPAYAPLAHTPVERDLAWTVDEPEPWIGEEPAPAAVQAVGPKVEEEPTHEPISLAEQDTYDALLEQAIAASGLVEAVEPVEAMLAETPAGHPTDPVAIDFADTAEAATHIQVAAAAAIDERPPPIVAIAEPVAEPAQVVADEVPASPAEPIERPGFFARTRFLWSSATRELRLQPLPEGVEPAASPGATAPRRRPAPAPTLDRTPAAVSVPPPPPIPDPVRPAPRNLADRARSVADPAPDEPIVARSEPRPRAGDAAAERNADAVTDRGAGQTRKPSRTIPPAQGPTGRPRQPTGAPRSIPGSSRSSDRRRSKGAAAEGAATESSRDWPSFADILAAHKAEAARVATARPAPRPVASEPVPTEVREPAHWAPPIWLVLPPAVLATLAGGALVVALSWSWSVDARSTGVVAGLLAAPGSDVKPLPESIRTPRAGWWGSTAPNLVQWALYYDRLAASEPAAAERAEEMLQTAARSAPLQAQVRFALARRPVAEAGAFDPAAFYASLGLSRDVESLAWSGRQWHRAGKPGPALVAYREALEMAARAEQSRLAAPTYDDESNVQRYRMPGEDLVGAVVRDMAQQQGWTFAAWSEALPRSALVWLTTARVLREKGDPDADKALESIIATVDSPAPAGCSPAVHLAAQAEALAMKLRWKEAEARYREAIELEQNETIRRTWWINLAEVDQKLFDESGRQRALEAAKGDDANDEIAQRAIDQLKYAAVRDDSVKRASR